MVSFGTFRPILLDSRLPRGPGQGTEAASPLPLHCALCPDLQ